MYNNFQTCVCLHTSVCTALFIFIANLLLNLHPSFNALLLLFAHFLHELFKQNICTWNKKKTPNTRKKIVAS